MPSHYDKLASEATARPWEVGGWTKERLAAGFGKDWWTCSDAGFAEPTDHIRAAEPGLHVIEPDANHGSGLMEADAALITALVNAGDDIKALWEAANDAMPETDCFQCGLLEELRTDGGCGCAPSWDEAPCAAYQARRKRLHVALDKLAPLFGEEA